MISTWVRVPSPAVVSGLVASVGIEVLHVVLVSAALRSIAKSDIGWEHILSFGVEDFFTYQRIGGMPKDLFAQLWLFDVNAKPHLDQWF